MVVAVENPARVQAFARTLRVWAKTDEADAQLIARHTQQHAPRPWTPPSPEEARLRALVSRLDDLTVMRTMEQARRKPLHEAAQPSVRNVLKTLEDEIERLRTARAAHRQRSQAAPRGTTAQAHSRHRG